MFGTFLFSKAASKLPQSPKRTAPTFAEIMLKADDDMAEYRRLKAERDMNRGYEG